MLGYESKRGSARKRKKRKEIPTKKINGSNIVSLIERRIHRHLEVVAVEVGRLVQH